MSIHSKKAFSLVEIVILFFVITAVFLAVVPLSVSNIKQAKFISEWKNYMNQVEYSYETLKEYKKEHPLNHKESVNRLMKYMDGRDIHADSKEIKNYRYKMMNGNFYQKMNIKKFDKVYLDERKRIIGVEYEKTDNENRCNNKTPCATVWVDINGKKKPNIVGKDIYVYELYVDKAEPYGMGMDISDLKYDCSHRGTGMSCSAFYILGGDLQ